MPDDQREDVLIGAMQLMPVAIGIFVESQLNDNVFEMGEGIFDNCATARQPNHAVLLTGDSIKPFHINSDSHKIPSNLIPSHKKPV